MSVEALSRASAEPPWRHRLALAALAIALVAGLVALAAAGVARPTPVPRGPHPFGLGVGESAAAASGLAGLLLAWQSAFFTALRGALATLRDGGGGAPLLLAIGFAYGVFHAAGPGHGKAIIAAYIVSSERALARGLAVSLAAALIQAGVAIGLVTAVFLVLGGTAAQMGRTVQGVEMAGFALVAGLGALLVWRKAGAMAALAVDRGTGSTSREACACGPVDPAATGGTFAQMAVVALGAGIRPCAGAIVVLTLARAYGIFALGIAATLAMALGTAITTGTLALVAVYAKRAALRLASGRSRGVALAAAGAELAAAAFVLVIGLALMAGIWDGVGGT